MGKRENLFASVSPVVGVILIFGLVSMLGDAVHEAARSVNGQYLSLLGVTAAQVGLVFGLGEFLGYALRLISGYLLDRTGRHWLYMFIGYGLHIGIPIMGLTCNWNILFILILMERVGKALRSPAKDTILSGVSEGRVGLGFAFGLQEALDQVGAFVGPLIFTTVFMVMGASGVPEFQLGYRWLLVPFLLLMLTVAWAERRVSGLQLKPVGSASLKSEALPRAFWLYCLFTVCVALGLVNFSLVGYHLKVKGLMADGTIAFLYACAMVVDALVALAVGRIYDRFKSKRAQRGAGVLVLVVVPVLTALLPLLTLGESRVALVSGILLMGVILGMHETVMRSAVADLTPYRKRGLGYGLFNTFYGLALLGGASLMGLLYDESLVGVLLWLVPAVEALALVVFWFLRKRLLGGGTVVKA